MPEVNPDVLRWARETAGLTEEAAARRIGLSAAWGLTPEQRLAALEVGEAQPTDAQLRKIADTYRRPLLTFYLEDAARQAARHGGYCRRVAPGHSRSAGNSA